jgi:methionyl-tRNA formyltransferase
MRKGAVVFAYSEVGCVGLSVLIEAGVDVLAVFTHEDDPEETLWFHSVRRLAEEHGIAVRTPELLDEEAFRFVEGLAPDLIFSFYYRMMIPEKFLRLSPSGAYNMHGSYLPAYRGRASVNWAVAEGATETGVTLHHMVARPDAGDIVDQERVAIGPDDTAADIFDRIVPAARLVLARTLPLILNGTAPRVRQDESKAFYRGRRRPEDGLIHWQRDAAEIHNLVRAVTHPYPGAFTFCGGKKLFVWQGKPDAAFPVASASPGAVVESSPLRVVTGHGSFVLHRVQFEGEDERDAADLLPAGTVLG